jgi:hypothetical protein
LWPFNRPLDALDEGDLAALLHVRQEVCSGRRRAARSRQWKAEARRER